jgi:quercetin dioxygenase-like cupin family protein
MKISHNFCDGIYAKEMLVESGYSIIQHKHEYDHLSILAIGVVELVVDGNKTIIEAPACIKIAAGKHHGIKALTNVAWYCIHKTDCEDENAVDATVIVEPNKQEFIGVFNLLKE